MRHGTETLRKCSWSYEGNFELILVMGWERELNSMRSNLPLFLSSLVVERSVVHWLVVGSNPTWGDLNHSEFFNSEWKGLFWPTPPPPPPPTPLSPIQPCNSKSILQTINCACLIMWPLHVTQKWDDMLKIRNNLVLFPYTIMDNLTKGSTKSKHILSLSWYHKKNGIYSWHLLISLHFNKFLYHKSKPLTLLGPDLGNLYT